MAGNGKSETSLRTDGVQLLSILLAISVSVGLTLGFNISWWAGVLSAIATMIGLTAYIRLASDDGVLARLARWVMRE